MPHPASRRLLPFLLLLGAGCAGLDVEQVGTLDVDLSTLGFEAAAVGSQTLLVAPRDGGLVAVDVATVQPRWSRRCARALLPEGAGDVFAIEHEPARLVRLDPLSGAVRGRAPLAPADPSERWYRRGDGLFLASPAQVRRISPNTGKPRWTTTARAVNGSLPDARRSSFNAFHVALSDDALLVPFPYPQQRILRLDPVGGQVAEVIAGEGAVSVATAGSRHYLLRPAGLTAYAGREPAWTVKLPKAQLPRRVVASSEWVVAHTVDGDPSRELHRLAAFRAADGELGWEWLGERRAGYVGYLALARDVLAYYDSTRKAIVARRLPSGAEEVVLELSGGLVVSTDAAGVAPAVPSGNPRFAPPYLIVPVGRKAALLRFGALAPTPK